MASWLERNSVSPEAHRRKPKPHFYMFSIPALELRRLCGIHRRQATRVVARADDLGIQRQHDKERSDEIARFVEYGYPWSTLSEAKRESRDFNDLRKPGWLPTSIVVNILTREDVRQNRQVDPSDIVDLEEVEDDIFFTLPYADISKGWRPRSVPPIEVIDGQHRLYAFEEDGSLDFELPVVAFLGLDISWQAYLFWTINIKPKRINASLAFDLYPLLRSEEWLDRAEGHAVYRDARAQELTESLWAHPTSPWYDRINMLGERQAEGVTQAAWIRALTATFVRPWLGRGARIGGLFGGRLSENEEVLGWSRAQQAAFLILAFDRFKKAVAASDAPWCEDLRLIHPRQNKKQEDPAFYGEYSLISTDQGIRGYLAILNDLCFMYAARLKLRSWVAQEDAAAADERAVSAALGTLAQQRVALFLTEIASKAATFDWRLSSAPNLSQDERRAKLVFRGSSGYREMRTQLLEHIARSEGDTGRAAELALERTTSA